jgi:cytochrome c-type biogenesis protein CcmF
MNSGDAMTVLGQVLVILAFAASLASVLTFTLGALRSGSTWPVSRLFLQLSSLFLFLASAVLVVLLVTHDFSNGYVYAYSDRTLPLHFLLSCFYAGQEGSFLFWALASCVLSLFLMSYSKKRGSEPWVMATFMAVQAGLLLLVLAKSPFQSIWQMHPEVPPDQIPPDGRGLNPLLQNFWMVIHPPILFIGFAAMAVPFSQAIGGLWQKRYALLSEQGLAWTLLAVAILGLGIMLGAYWAYGVLGWGGYWGWDPVENSSLVPWLTGLALVHTILAQRRTEKYLRTNLILAIGSFFLVIYSTFLTRSGILGDASVHAFTDPGATVYWLLLSFLAAILVTGGLFLGIRWKELLPPTSHSPWFTREMALAAGSAVIVLSAVVILFGTSLPIFSTSRAEPSFYDSTNLPLTIVMGLLIGFSLYMQWEDSDGKETARRSWRAFAAALAVTVVCIIAGMHDPGTTALAFAAFFALFVNVDIGLKVIKGDPLFLGGKLSHIGLALFLLGVISTGKYATTRQAQLPLHTPVSVLGYTLTYTGYHPTVDNKYAFTITAEKEGEKFILSPVMFEAGPQGVMRNPDIASTLLRDFYVSPLSLQGGTNEEQGGGEEFTLEKGKAAPIAGVQATFTEFDMDRHMMGQPNAGGVTVGAKIDLQKGSERETIAPVVTYGNDGTPTPTPAPSRLLQVPVRLIRVNVDGGGGPSTITIDVHHGSEPSSSQPETLIVDASVKPFINLLWGGTVVLLAGFALAIVKRFRE